MLSQAQLNRIADAIYHERGLYGCAVGYYGGGQSRSIRPARVPGAGAGVTAIIEEIPANRSSVGVTVMPSARPSAAPSFVPAAPQRASTPNPVVTPTPVVSNRSVLGRELMGAGLSCGLTALSVLSITAGAAAEIPSGGTSTVLVVAGWTGLVTASLQCANGLTRMGAIALDPNGNTLQQWDSNSVYSAATLVVDAFGVASGVAGLPNAVRNLAAVLQRSGRLVQSAEQLASLARPDRLRLVQNAIQEASKTPAGRAALEKALRDAGLSSRQVAQTMGHGADTIRRGRLVMNALQGDSSIRLTRNIRDIVAAFGGFVVSATPQEWTGSGSGSLNFLLQNASTITVNFFSQSH